MLSSTNFTSFVLECIVSFTFSFSLKALARHLPSGLKFADKEEVIIGRYDVEDSIKPHKKKRQDSTIGKLRLL